MSDVWSGLRLAAIEGVEFDPASRNVQGGHEFGRHRYQGRGGQDTEPTGRSPLVISLVIELFASVDPSHYPLKYNELANVFTDDELGGQVEYIDPVFGVLPMQISTFTLDENANRRDGGVITVVLEERSTEALDLTVPIVGSRPGPRAVAAGRDLDQSLPSAGVFDETLVRAFSSSGYPLSGAEYDYPLGSVMENVARAGVDRLTLGAVSVDFARGEVDTFRARIDALLSAPELQAAEAWEQRRTLVVLADALEQTAFEAVAKNGTESTFTPSPAGTTAQAVAVQVYGDARRWPDVVAADSRTRNPLRMGSTTPGAVRVFTPRTQGTRGRFT